MGRLKHLDAPRRGEALDCAGRWAKAAPGGAIRLGQDKGYLVLRVQQPRQRPFGKLGRTGED